MEDLRNVNINEWFEDGKYYGVAVELINPVDLYDMAYRDYGVTVYQSRVVGTNGLMLLKYNAKNNSFIEPFTNLELPLWCRYAPNGYKDNMNPYDDVNESGYKYRIGSIDSMWRDVVEHPLIINCATHPDVGMRGEFPLDDMDKFFFEDDENLRDVINNRTFTQKLSSAYRMYKSSAYANYLSYCKYKKHLKDDERITPEEFRNLDEEKIAISK